LASEWLQTMSDLIPARERDPDGVPVSQPGLAYLADQVAAHIGGRSGQEAGILTELVEALRTLKKENELYDADQKLDRATKERHTKWRAEVSTLVRRIIELTYSRMVTPGLTEGNRPRSGSGVPRERGEPGPANAKATR